VVREEMLVYQREIGNIHNPFAVKVGNIVGHLLKKISSRCSLFLRRGGMLMCKITNPNKQYSRDLGQGGLEIPCLVIFQGEQELLDKVKKFLSFINEKRPTTATATIETAHKIKQETGEADITPETKRIKVEQADELNHSNISGEVWATCTGTRIKLYADNKLFLEGNCQLNGKHIKPY